MAALRAGATSTRTRELLALHLPHLEEARELRVEQMFKQASFSCEVAFLVDITGSMAGHIKAVAKQVHAPNSISV